MSLVQASRTAEVDGYIGYLEPYATSHQALDEDEAFQQETRNAARALGNAILFSRAGRYQRPDEEIEDPIPEVDGFSARQRHCEEPLATKRSSRRTVKMRSASMPV